MTYLIIFIVCVITSSYGSLFGGGALVSLPIMMMLGIPPHIALANNRVGALGVHIGFLLQVFKSKSIQFRYVLPLSALAILCALLGSLTLVSLPENMIENAVSILLILMLVFMIYKPEVGLQPVQRSHRKKTLGWIITSVILLWQSTFGVIASALYFVMCYFFGFSLIQASSTQKIPAICGGLVATAVFLMFGLIDPLLVLTIFVADLIGSYLGAKFFLHQTKYTIAYVFKGIMVVNIFFLIL